MSQRWIELSVPLALATSLACSSAAPPPAAPSACPARVPQLEVSGGARLNASPGADGLPVQVAVYQLAHESALARATFDELWADAAGALGESLLERRELTLFPGSTQTIDWPLRSETRVLAAVALFREPRGRDWTMSYALTAADPNKACPAAHPRIQLWLDGMKIRDGAGRPGDTH